MAAEEGVYLAYRLRRPIGAGRGYAVGLAFAPDGDRFQTFAVISKDQVATESLERPELIRLPDELRALK